MVGDSDVNVMTALKSMVDDKMRSTFTASLCIVDEVDRDNQRCTVYLKEDEEIFIGNVPIASPFARSGQGVITPLKQDDEGLLFHTREPINSKLAERGPIPTEANRHHTLEDGIFFPMIWFDEDDPPPFEEGQHRIYHDPEDGQTKIDVRRDPLNDEMELLIDVAGDVTSVLFSADGLTIETDKSVTVEAAEDVTVTVEGGVIIDCDDVSIGSSGLAAILNENAVIEYEDTGDTGDGSAGTTTKVASIADPGTTDSEAG